jgi:hypothetical protein
MLLVSAATLPHSTLRASTDSAGAVVVASQRASKATSVGP